MNTTHLKGLRLGVLVAAALLVAEGTWSLQVAAENSSLFTGAFAIGAFFAALGLLKKQAWSRLYVYAAAALLLVTATYYVGTAAMLGQFATAPLGVVGTSLAPVLMVCVLGISSAEVVRRYFRAVSGRPAEEARQEGFAVTRGSQPIAG